MKALLNIVPFLFLTISSYGQLIIGGEAEKQPEKKQETKADTLKKKELDGETSLYFVANWSQTSRSLTPNGDFFGEELGKRADEKSLNIWSYGLGFQSKLNKFLMWDGGISLTRNGESYAFKAADSTYNYQSKYMYFSMPIRVSYYIGNAVKFYAGIGVVPQMFMGYRQDVQYTTATNASYTEEIKTKIGYSPFVISGIMNVGVLLDFQNNWSLLVSPEARIQLNSSYNKQDDYIHKGRAYGITFGLLRNL